MGTRWECQCLLPLALVLQGREQVGAPSRTELCTGRQRHGGTGTDVFESPTVEAGCEAVGSLSRLALLGSKVGRCNWGWKQPGQGARSFAGAARGPVGPYVGKQLPGNCRFGAEHAVIPLPHLTETGDTAGTHSSLPKGFSIPCQAKKNPEGDNFSFGKGAGAACRGAGQTGGKKWKCPCSAPQDAVSRLRFGSASAGLSLAWK